LVVIGAPGIGFPLCARIAAAAQTARDKKMASGSRVRMNPPFVPDYR
jgi:hypothetical protein